MSTLLGKIVADFTTTLATSMAVGATTATLQSATDDDSISLPAGHYFFAIDGNNSQKEHISCDLSGTSLTNIKTLSRQGVEVAGVVRTHRVGSTVTLTDFAHIKYINDLVSGATTFNASAPLGYDGTASITTANQFATKAYVDGVSVAGAANADSTTKGIVEEATQTEVDARTAAGGTAARLYQNPTTIRSTLLSDYVADTGAADVYVITPVPAIAAYATGQRFTFKVSATNLTSTPTLNVNTKGATTIKKQGTAALSPGDLLLNQIVEVEYDGASFQLMTPTAITTPIGTMMMYAGASAPTGFVFCDGSSLLRAGTYAGLFAILSTTFGTADGTHFNVPDMRGRIPVGVGTGAGGAASGTGLPTGGSALTAVALAGWKGEETHVLTTAELASHSHSYNNPAGGSISIGGGSGNYAATTASASTGSAGSDTAHNNIQPQMGVNFIIKF